MDQRSRIKGFFRYAVIFVGAVAINFLLGAVLGLIVLGEGASDAAAIAFLAAAAVVTGFFAGLVITRKPRSAAQVAVITGTATAVMIWLGLLIFNEGQQIWPFFVAPVPAVLAGRVIDSSNRA